MVGVTRWLRLTQAAYPAVPVERDRSERRALILELAIVGTLTFAFSAVAAMLYLLEASLTGGIGQQTVELNPVRSALPAIDAVRQLLSVARLFAIGGLGGYLLWRGGLAPQRFGLGRPSLRVELPAGVGLALLIGVPGLGLVFAAQALGLNADLHAAPSDTPWWRYVMLVLLAVGNAVAEEIVVVAYFMVRLRQLGVGNVTNLAASAVLRGGYHLYQGFGGGLGNLAMGLVFGRWYQVTGRLWPLIIAHALIDVVAFVGYALLY